MIENERVIEFSRHRFPGDCTTVFQLLIAFLLGIVSGRLRKSPRVKTDNRCRSPWRSSPTNLTVNRAVHHRQGRATGTPGCAHLPSSASHRTQAGGRWHKTSHYLRTRHEKGLCFAVNECESTAGGSRCDAALPPFSSAD